MTKTKNALWLALYATLIAGCQTAPPSLAEAQTEQRSASFEQHDNSLYVTSSDGDASITIEFTIVPNDEIDSLADPTSAEPFLANAVARNRHGYPFIVVGGSAEEMPEPTLIDQDEQLADLELILKTVGDLERDREVSQDFYVGLESLASATESAIDSANAVYDGRVPKPEGSQDKSRNTYIQNFFITYKPSYWIFGDHSAVRIDVYRSTGQYVGTLSTRNHGTEASHWSMRPVPGCPRTFYNRPTPLPPIQPWRHTDTFLAGDAGGCNSRYWFYNGYGHVCNDDSLAMLHMAIENKPIYSHPTCRDYVLRTHAPSCY